MGNACFLCKGRGVSGLGGEGGRGKDGLAAGEMKPRPGTKLKKRELKEIRLDDFHLYGFGGSDM